MRKVFLALAVTSLALGGCSTVDSLFGARAEALPTLHAGYMAQAAASDLFEIDSANLALAKAQRPDVRAFAEIILRDHSRSAEHLAQAAQNAGWVAPPATLDADQQVMLNELEHAGPGTADALFVGQQIAAHKRAYDLHRTYAQVGESLQLRQFAAIAAPTVEQHLLAAQRLG